jgi:DNA-binding MurR/RpiR family transcriptional regulator
MEKTTEGKPGGVKKTMDSIKKDFFDKILKTYPSLSPKKKRVADFMLKDYKKIFLMTAREIAQECRVSEPTINRFVMDLGFSGYVEFTTHLKGLLHSVLTSVDRQAKANERLEGRMIDQYCQNAFNNIENLRRTISSSDLEQTARLIHRAETVFVVGYRASATLAFYFGYLLKKIRDNVFVDTTLSWDLSDSLIRSAKTSVLFAISFPRYPRRTIEVIEYAKRNHVKIIGLSDTSSSPIMGLSDHYVMIDVEGISFIDPFSHIMVYLSALVHEIILLDKPKAMAHLARLEEGLQESREFFTPEWIHGDVRGNEGKSFLPEWITSEVGKAIGETARKRAKS